MTTKSKALQAVEAQIKALKDVLDAPLAEMIEERLKRLAETNVTRTPPPSPVVTTDSKDLKFGAAQCMSWLYAAGGDIERAISMAEDAGKKGLADLWNESLERSKALKAMGQDTLAGGGALLPPQFVEEIIEELGAKAVVRALGLTVVPMNGSLTLSYIDQNASAAYVGEAQNATESTPTTGQLQLNEKTLIALGVLSNQLLANGGPRVQSAIQDHLIRVLKRKEDITFIRSLGTQFEPKGMLYHAIAANKFNATGSYDVAKVTTDLGKAVGKLMGLDVDLDSGAGWVFAPRTYTYLTTARDGNNNLVWQPEMARGMLMGFPFKITSQIPITLGSGDKSEVYFASFVSLILGESENMEVMVFPDGAYHDGTAVVSGISTYQSPIRIVARHDLGAQQRGQEIAVIEAVDWL